MKPYALAAVALLLAGCGPEARPGPTQHETRTVELGKAELTRVDLRMGAGELHVSGGSSHLADADFTYNVDNWKPRVEYHSTGVRDDLEISQPEGASAIGNTEYRWDIRLNDGALVDLVTKLGAGEAHMNLGSMNLRNVELNMGVGEVEMDLRGSPKRSYDVRINGGVGQATVRLPRSVGISATAQGGIGDINVEGLEQRNGRWINPSQLNSPITIRVDVKGGVGEIKLIAE
ncbi:MAG: toast rack family protein [Acidobacteriota bacterium]